LTLTIGVGKGPPLATERRMPPPSTPETGSLDDMQRTCRGCVVAIGNFDGVHRGHQAVLRAARHEAKRRGVACIMLTLEPHPRAFFSGKPLFRLTPAPLKAALAAALGFNGTIVLPFDRALAKMSAEDFVKDVLVDRLAISAAVTGYDFAFGRARQGTPEFLKAEGERHGFAVTIVPALVEGAEAVSSTRIRAALSRGELDTANALLGWRFAVAGTIIPGDKRGRELGYPTANMALDPASELAEGVYAVRYLRADGSLHPGVASYGRRPTFGHGDRVFETFLFDFSGDLYGEEALVSLYGFIRPERRFDSAGALVTQMEKDSIDARALLERHAPGELDVRLREAWAGKIR
jgi:riboflavin kinase/FMN adenylyltransferase